MQTKNDKVIFFDCYQTLLNICLDKESQPPRGYPHGKHAGLSRPIKFPRLAP